MNVRVGEQEYPPENAVVVASRRGESLHPEGTPELPCSACGSPCPVDARSASLHLSHGMAVVCVWCAAARYPDMLVGTKDGEPVTLRRWLAGRGNGMQPAEVDADA